MRRIMSQAFITEQGARLAVSTFSQRKRAAEELHARLRKLQVRVVAAAGIVTVCGLTAGIGYGLTRPVDQPGLVRNGKSGDALREALRFGEIRVPIAGNACLAYDFDNKTGQVVTETAVRCVEPLPPPSATPQGPGPEARVRALSNAFKH